MLLPLEGLLPAPLSFVVAELVEGALEAAVDLFLSLSAVLSPVAFVPDVLPDWPEAEPPPDTAFSPEFCGPDSLAGLLSAPDAVFDAVSLTGFVAFDLLSAELDLSAPDGPPPDLEPALGFPPFDGAFEPEAVLRSESALAFVVPDWAAPADEAPDFPASPAWALGGAAGSDGLLVPLDLRLSSDGAEDLARSALFWSRLS